jgi:tetratricopeptide (TPR) repeat protein
MFTKDNSCPVCFAPWSKDYDACVSCGSIAELYYERPFPARETVDEEKLTQNMGRVRAYLVDHGNHGLARYTLGLSYVDLGLLSEGLIEIGRAAQLLPEKLQVAYEAVVLAAKQGDFSDEILNQLSRVIDRKPDFKEALYLKGVILKERKRFTDAVRVWQSAYRIDPDYAPPCDELQQFIQRNVKLLRNPSSTASIRTIRTYSLPQNAIDYLDLISSGEPLKPPPLGITSMRVLETVSQEKAKLMRKMYGDDLHQYEELMRRRSAELGALEEDVIALSELSIAAVKSRAQLSSAATTKPRSSSSGSARQLSVPERSRILDAEVQTYQKQGYTLITRTETTAQLSKEHEFSCCWAVILTLLVIGVLYLLYYITTKKQNLLFLEVDKYGRIHKTHS